MIASPGASSESIAATFEYEEILSFLFVEPTLTAEDTHAGVVIDHRDAAVAGRHGAGDPDRSQVVDRRFVRLVVARGRECLSTKTHVDGNEIALTCARIDILESGDDVGRESASTGSHAAAARGVDDPREDLYGHHVRAPGDAGERCACDVPLPAAIPATWVPWKHSLVEHGSADP